MTVTTSRWIAKKGARKVASLVPFPATRGLRALTYHDFGEHDRDPFSVTAHAFERQVAAIAASGLALSPDELAAFVRGGNFEGRVFVTIDDGIASVQSIALPILREHGVGAMLFVVGEWIGKANHMDAAGLRRAADDGVVVGSHSMSHAMIAQRPLDQQRREIVGSRSAIEDMIGRPVETFAYPYGTRRAYSDGTRRLVEEAGYTTAFTTQHGAITPADDRLALPRIKVEGGDDMALFRALCRGGLDKWRLVDHLLASIQRPEPDRAPTA